MENKLQCLQCGEMAAYEERYRDLNVRKCPNGHRTVDLDLDLVKNEKVA
jgi:hypothetical protein